MADVRVRREPEDSDLLHGRWVTSWSSGRPFTVRSARSFGTWREAYRYGRIVAAWIADGRPGRVPAPPVQLGGPAPVHEVLAELVRRITPPRDVPASVAHLTPLDADGNPTGPGRWHGLGSVELDAAIRRHPSGRREPTVGELGLVGHSDDDRLGPDAARTHPAVEQAARFERECARRRDGLDEEIARWFG